MEYTAYLYESTYFGNDGLVWNVPNPNTFDFDGMQRTRIYENVYLRFPHLLTRLVLKGDYDPMMFYCDYLVIKNEIDTLRTCYFVNTIIGEKGVIILDITLDVITTYGILNAPISGTIIRKHDMNRDETPFDYPTALNFTGNFQNEKYTYVGYDAPATRLIESTIDLKAVHPAKTLVGSDGSITIPVLPKPEHTTNFTVTTWDQEYIVDNSNAFTLYLNDLVDQSVLDTVRGLSGDGAISDSYTVPSEAVVINASGSGITGIRGRFLTKTLSLKLQVDYEGESWYPRNEAIKGMMSVSITSMQEKTKATFPGWELKQSTNEDGFIRVNLWCDPKPSGAPYCSPDQVLTLFPNENTGIITLATLEVKSVRGGQWLRSPLIYNTGKGELFSSAETQLQRVQADYEQKVALHQLEMSKREREIRIAQSDYNYQSGLASSLINGGASLLTGNVSGVINQAKGAYDASSNHKFLEQMQALQAYEQEAEKQLIKMAHSNNLNNLNVQESLRRVVPREAAYAPNESLGEYDQYNGFTVSVTSPDLDSLKAKDWEYSLYGYPVYEHVENFSMLSRLRSSFSVYQFENPVIYYTGQVGELIRAVLESGIRICNVPFTPSSVMYNSKPWS